MEELTGAARERMLKKLAKAKTEILLNQPFFASLLFKLPIREDPYCPTMATNGREIIYNPWFVDSLDVELLQSVFIHEMYHIILKHPMRLGSREPFKANIAMDYAVNWLIRQGSFKLPDGCLYNEKYANWIWEEIYNDLPTKECDHCQCSQGESGEGEGGNGEGNSKEDKGSGSKGKTKKSAGSKGDVCPKCGKKKGQCGGKPGGSKPGTAGQWGEVQSSGGTEEQKRSLESQWDLDIAQALHEAKQRGLLPAGLERFVEDLLEPKLPWQEILQRFMTEVIKNDYSWRQPNKRHIQRGFYLPQLGSPAIGKIVLAIDTSGSMGRQELTEVASEVVPILEMTSGDLDIISVDAAVGNAQQISDIYEFEPKGGGGTDFVPAFTYVEEEDLDPSALIYMTDGYCDSFPDPPPYPVLWMLTRPNEHFKPPFGEVVILDR